MAEQNFKRVKAVIGLGNPGRKYEGAYHNAGMLFVGHLKEARGNLDNLLKSDVFMNNSGRFVRRELKKRGLEPKELLVAHDDSDIALGKFKFSFGRGSAGHKGVNSVIEALGTKNFWRLRIGIRPKTLKGIKAGKFVLKKISPAGKKALKGVFEEADSLLWG